MSNDDDDDLPFLQEFIGPEGPEAPKAPDADEALRRELLNRLDKVEAHINNIQAIHNNYSQHVQAIMAEDPAVTPPPPSWTQPIPLHAQGPDPLPFPPFVPANMGHPITSPIFSHTERDMRAAKKNSLLAGVMIGTAIAWAISLGLQYFLSIDRQRMLDNALDRAHYFEEQLALRRNPQVIPEEYSTSGWGLEPEPISSEPMESLYEE